MPTPPRYSIAAQKEIILNIIQHNVGNISSLEAALAEIKVKPQAVIEVLDKNSGEFSPEVIAALHRKRITIQIGGVKTRPLVIAGEKSGGLSEGRLVKKALSEDEAATAKHENIWMQKNGPLIQLEKGSAKTPNRAEEIGEYIGANLMYEIYAQMGQVECSPKIRLHKNTEGEVTLLSRFIADFSTIRELEQIGGYSAAEKKKAQRFALFFIANLLIGDYDLHSANVGFRKVKGNHYWARVDLGRSLSYHASRSDNLMDSRAVFTSDPGSVAGFIFLMYNSNRGKALYEAADFYSFKFDCELLRIEKSLDTSHFGYVLQHTFRNIREAYGDGWLQEKSVAKIFSRGMGLSGELTEEGVIDRILENVARLRKGLQERGREMVARVFPRHTDQAIDAYNVCADENGWDSAAFLNRMIEAGVNIASKEHFKLEGFLKFSSTPNSTENGALLYDIIKGMELSTVPKLLDNPDITREMLSGCINNMIAKPEYRNHEAAVLIAGHAKSRIFVGGLMQVALQKNDREVYCWLESVDRKLLKEEEKNVEENMLSPEALHNLAAEIFPNHILCATECYNKYLDSRGIVNNRRFLIEMLKGKADISKREDFNLKRFLEVNSINSGTTEKQVLHSIIGGYELSLEDNLFRHPDIDKAVLVDYLYEISDNVPNGVNSQLITLLLFHIGNDYTIEGKHPFDVLLSQYEQKRDWEAVEWLYGIKDELQIWGDADCVKQKPSPQVHSATADRQRATGASTRSWGWGALLNPSGARSAQVAPSLT